MKFKTLDDFDFKGKKVLLRSDLNSERLNGEAVMSSRIFESAKTIKELMQKKAKVVILAHQGQPGREDFGDLKSHAKLLNKFVKVKFVSDVIGEKAISEIKKLKEGEALLLDNVRFLDDEFKPSLDSAMVKTLAPLFDIYINDAFSVAHRSHSSIVSFAQLMDKGVGRLMERELKSIEKLQVKDALYILGGSKEENIKLMKPGRKIFVAGVFGHLCLSASGKNLGAQEDYLKREFKEYGRLISELKGKLGGVAMAEDLAVKNDKGKRMDLKISEFPSKFEIFDIGPATLKKYVSEIMKSKVILMKGTAGYCEDKQFQTGTKEIFKAMIASKAFTVLGGGHTTTALEHFGISEKKFGYVSLSGGAFVSYLAGEKLPGLEALQRDWKK